LAPRQIADPRVGAKTSSLVGTLNSTKPEPTLAPTSSEAPNVAAPAPAPAPTIESDAEPSPFESKPPGATDNAAAEATPASIATLSSSERTALPPLKLSMHVWAEEPGKRFAILDGERVIEGSMLSGAVVAQIRRDGLVLDIGGRRLWLPRP
jgi:general secretion pathway protein B